MSDEQAGERTTKASRPSSGPERTSGTERRRRGSASRAPNTSQRLEDYVERTQSALDLLALLTLWIVVVPLRHLGLGEDITVGGVAIRLAVSVVYGIDLAIRAHLAPRHGEYVRTHPLALISVLLPPIRVIFSLRLITSLFRRGNIGRFLLAAVILLLNGSIIVYYYEYDAPHANITTPWESIWWAVVTVATVGYGDYFPVSAPGRIVASGIMAMGILTLAVITAQVSSSFVEQSRRRRLSLPDEVPVPDPSAEGPHIQALHARLERIEAHLARIVSAQDDERAAVAPDPPTDSPPAGSSADRDWPADRPSDHGSQDHDSDA